MKGHFFLVHENYYTENIHPCRKIGPENQTLFNYDGKKGIEIRCHMDKIHLKYELIGEEIIL